MKKRWVVNILLNTTDIKNKTMAYNGIHINPANRGKFTAAAKQAGMSVQEFASHVLANKDDYSSTQVKRANFARNAAGWQHEDGGEFYNQNYNTMKNGGSTYQDGVWFQDGGNYAQQYQGDIYPSTYGPVMLEDQNYNYNKLGYSGGSIVDMLNQAGLPSNLAARKKMAQAIGMKGYTGKDYENQYLMQAIQQQPEIALVAAKVERPAAQKKKPTKAEVIKQLAEEAVQSPYPGVVSDVLDPAAFYAMAQQAYLSQNPGFVPPVARQAQLLPANNPRSAAAQAWVENSYPMTSLGYRMRGQQIPNNFEKGEINPYDQALAMVNPFKWAHDFSNTGDDIVQGNYSQAALDAASVLPFLAETRGIAPGLQLLGQDARATGNYLLEGMTNSGVNAANATAKAAAKKLGSKTAVGASEEVLKQIASKMGLGNKKVFQGLVEKYGLMEAMRMADANKGLLGSSAANKILRGFKKGGDVMEVTPEELKMLRQQGYNVEIL